MCFLGVIPNFFLSALIFLHFLVSNIIFKFFSYFKAMERIAHMAVMFNVENASITPINHKIIVLLSFSILSMSSTLNDANPLSIFSVSSTLNDASPPFPSSL